MEGICGAYILAESDTNEADKASPCQDGQEADDP